MEKLKEFDIAFGGLSQGIHSFNFEIDEKFFANFENALVQKGMLNARVQLTKQSSMLVFDLNLTGFINAQCDRCGDDFELPLNTHGQLLVKFGDEAREVDVDVFIIPATETHFNIAQQLYEYICVTKPLHIVHPDDKNGNSTCNPVFLKKLKDINNHPENRKEKNGDPRWDALKNLKL